MGLDIETVPLLGLLPHFNVGFTNLVYVYYKLIVSKIRNPTFREVWILINIQTFLGLRANGQINKTMTVKGAEGSRSWCYRREKSTRRESCRLSFRDTIYEVFCLPLSLPATFISGTTHCLLINNSYSVTSEIVKSMKRIKQYMDTSHNELDYTLI